MRGSLGAVVQTVIVRTVLVSLPSGSGVVRHDDGSIVVTNDAASGGGGTYLRSDDKFHPVKTWVEEEHSTVGGLLPPGAVSADVVDDRGRRVPAAVANGAYIALLEQPNDGEEPIVCCRDRAGDPVRRPWAADYPSVRVTDAEEPCPACGSTDYDEYRPFEHWRGGQRSPNGTLSPLPVVSCRACGHEEREGGFMRSVSEGPEGEDDETKAERMATAPARQRHRQWATAATTLAGASFPIYGAEGWAARLGGSGGQDGQCTEVTVNHYDTPYAEPWNGERPRFTVTTELGALHPHGAVERARSRLESWVANEETTPCPDASRAAITLWLRGRDRERRAAVLGAMRSEQHLTINDTPIAALVLRTQRGRWVAAAASAEVTIIVAAHDLQPPSLRLRAIADPISELLGPEPPRQ